MWLMHGPHRLVVRTSRRGRDNPGSTPGVDTFRTASTNASPFQHVVVGHVVFSHISPLTAVFAPPPPAQGSHHPTTAALRFCFVRAQKQNVSDCGYKGLALPVCVVANQNRWAESKLLDVTYHAAGSGLCGWLPWFLY